VVAVLDSVRTSQKKALGAIFVLVSISASACMDPLSISKESFGFTIKNDLPVTVVVELCSNPACTQDDVRYTLAPHASIKEGGEPDGAVRSWKILTTSGGTVGCMPFRFTNRFSTEPTFGVSKHVPCGSDGGVGAIGKADWPRA
jgi:hypothetical protein